MTNRTRCRNQQDQTRAKEERERPGPIPNKQEADYRAQTSVAPFPMITQPAGRDIRSSLQASLPDRCSLRPALTTQRATVITAELKRPQALKSDQGVILQMNKPRPETKIP